MIRLGLRRGCLASVRRGRITNREIRRKMEPPPLLSPITTLVGTLKFPLDGSIRKYNASTYYTFKTKREQSLEIPFEIYEGARRRRQDLRVTPSPNKLSPKSFLSELTSRVTISMFLDQPLLLSTLFPLAYPKNTRREDKNKR